MKFALFFSLFCLVTTEVHASQSLSDLRLQNQLRMQAYRLLTLRYPHLAGLAQSHNTRTPEKVAIEDFMNEVAFCAFRNREHNVILQPTEAENAFNRLETKNEWERRLQELDDRAPHPPLRVVVSLGGIQVRRNEANGSMQI